MRAPLPMGRHEYGVEKGRVSVLIVAKAGPLQEGLHALLAAMPEISHVMEVGDLPSALGMAGAESPSLILLDADLASGETWRAVRRIKARWNLSRCIVLASDVAQEREAASAGADAVLLKGVSASRIVAEVVRLIVLQRA